MEMAIKQTIWSLDDKKELSLSTLNSEKELESLISNNIGLLRDDWLLIGSQVRTLYGGIIDLLCIDAGGNPVVVELKKSLTPREVTAQALDYASWVNEIDADELAQIFLKHSKGKKSLNDAFWEHFGVELNDDNDEVKAKIVIVATDMDGSTERIIKYLQGYDIDINVLFFKVFEHNGKRLLSRAWMIDAEQNSITYSSSKSWNGEFYFSYGTGEQRSWEDAVEYGFVSAGGGSWYTNTLDNLELGNRIWVNIPGIGYVGVGTVAEESISAHDAEFKYKNKWTAFFDLPLNAAYHKKYKTEKAEYLVKINWEKTVSQEEAISEYGFFGNQNTVCRPKSDKWGFTIKRLKELWKID